MDLLPFTRLLKSLRVWGSATTISGRKVELVNGYYQAKNSLFKFSEYYYNKLWSTVRGAPFLQAEEIFCSAKYPLTITKNKSLTTRHPFTNEELKLLTAHDFVKLKLTEDEIDRLRQINRERAQERIASSVRVQAEAACLLSAFQVVGLKIRSIDDLLNMSEKYTSGIPILLKHLQMPYSDTVKETIARSLVVPEQEVRKAWSLLANEYRHVPQGRSLKGPGDTQELI